MTVRFPYNLCKVSVRTVPFGLGKKSQGDCKECKHISRSLELPMMPEKSYLKHRQIKRTMSVANVTGA